MDGATEAVAEDEVLDRGERGERGLGGEDERGERGESDS